MLLRYLEQPLTDLEMHALIGIPESRVSARRSGLMQRGWVTWVWDIEGPHGAQNSVWGLTQKGRLVAAALKERR